MKRVIRATNSEKFTSNWSDYDSLSEVDEAEVPWNIIQNALQTGNYSSVEDFEKAFDLITLECQAINNLGLEYDQNNENGSIVFFTFRPNEVVGVLTVDEFDNIIRNAIMNTSDRSGFVKAVATSVKRALDL